MVYRFVIRTDEVEDFRRELLISPYASFRELNDLILKSVGYAEGEMTYFSICHRNWVPYQQVLLVDMGTTPEDEDLYLMDETPLDTFMQEKGDRMLYTFDILGDRSFYIELAEVILNEEVLSPKVSLSQGKAPAQYTDPMDLLLADTAVKYRQAKGGTNPSTQGGEEEEDFGMDDLEVSLEDLDLDGFDLSSEF